MGVRYADASVKSRKNYQHALSMIQAAHLLISNAQATIDYSTIKSPESIDALDDALEAIDKALDLTRKAGE